MNERLTKFQELAEMRDNVRRCVEALEQCWSCERVGECEQETVGSGGPVWLCTRCLKQLRDFRAAKRRALLASRSL